MGLLQLVRDPCVFREVPIGQMHLWKALFHLLIDPPANNTHLGGITKALCASLDLVLLMRLVNMAMAGLAQRDQVLWAIATRLSAFDMMHIEYRVFGFAVAPLAAMLVSKQHILPCVPETQLWPLLVLTALDIGGAQFL